MKSKIVFSCILMGLILSISALWLQMRALEVAVSQLSQKLLLAPSIQPVVTQSPEPNANIETREKTHPFKLIEVSNVGVPWSVEHAMIGEGNQQPATLAR